MSFSPSLFRTLKHHVDIAPTYLKNHPNLFNWPKMKNLKMIEIGTGPGNCFFAVEPLLPKDYAEIFCTDNQEGMINYFKSLPNDPRISGSILDIQAENLPEEMKHRFDFAFSAYCFMFLDNYRQAFKNSRELLTNGGELFYVWCKRAHLYDFYKGMSKIEKWSPYVSDFKNWKNYFDNENATGTLREEIIQAGLEVIKIEEIGDVYFEYEKAEKFLDVYDSLDFLSKRVPKCDLQKFKEDFHKLVLEEVKIDENAEFGRKARFHFPTLVLAARRS